MTSLAALRRRVNRARRFPTLITCPASRHVHIMAECLAKGEQYPMMMDEPEYCAESMLMVLASLWEARAEIVKLKEKDKNTGS